MADATHSTTPRIPIATPELEAWRLVYRALRIVGEISVREREGAASGDDYMRLSSEPAFGVHRSTSGDADVGRELASRAKEVLERCASAVTTPVAEKRHDDEAVLCWWCHVSGGVPIKSVPSFLKAKDGSRLLAAYWAHPDKTVRERMWAANEWRPPKVTLGSFAGLLRIVRAWADEFDLTLAERRALPVAGESIGRPLEGDAIRLLGDASAANGVAVMPNSQLIKGWQIQNVGELTWRDRYLTRLGVIDGTELPRSRSKIRLPTTPPQGIVDIAVRITTPRRPGTYTTYWSVTDRLGTPFFDEPDDLVFTFLVRAVA